jgi:hypothetical protein
MKGKKGQGRARQSRARKIMTVQGKQGEEREGKAMLNNVR